VESSRGDTRSTPEVRPWGRFRQTNEDKIQFFENSAGSGVSKKTQENTKWVLRIFQGKWTSTLQLLNEVLL